MSIIMTGGGTGGHLAIIKAVKEQLRGVELIYVGSSSGQDRAWFEGDDDFSHCYFLETRGVVNQGPAGKVKSMFMLAKATKEAMNLIEKHHAKVVFSVGGFSAAATSFAAKLKGIPLVIHEQNAALGSLNRLLKPYSEAFISSYLADSPIHAYPVKKIFFEKARLRSDIRKIIFLGGSQGAQAINRLAVSLAPELKKRGIEIIHQAGEKNIEDVKAQYRSLGIEAEVFGFTTKLADYMHEADFAIARSGASTLWELAATGLPALFIPYPYAASDHQYYNAKFLVDRGLAWLMREDEVDEAGLLAILDDDPGRVSSGLIETVERGGSQEIAALLMEKGDIKTFGT